MLLSDIVNKEYRFCEFSERQKSVLYKDIDLDVLLDEIDSSEENN